jgi:hypothetical protein
VNIKTSETQNITNYVIFLFRNSASVAVLGEVLYAMGDCDSVRKHNKAELYDCKTDQWSFVAPMNVRHWQASVTGLNGKMNAMKQEGICKKCINECMVLRSYLSVSMPTF